LVVVALAMTTMGKMNRQLPNHSSFPILQTIELKGFLPSVNEMNPKFSCLVYSPEHAAR
jgi:hypothetical protein